LNLYSEAFTGDIKDLTGLTLLTYLDLDHSSTFVAA
jgi:hypothetical protein